MGIWDGTRARLRYPACGICREIREVEQRLMEEKKKEPPEDSFITFKPWRAQREIGVRAVEGELQLCSDRAEQRGDVGS